MRELRKQDRTSSRLPTDTERKYKLGQIELTAEELQELKNKLVIDEHLSTTSTNAIANKTVANALNNKVTKEEGKTLSSNDFTDEYKQKVDDLAAGGEGSTVELIGTTGTPSDTNTYHANAIKELTKEVYSIEERVIGTWIDGKPLYSRMVIVESIGNNVNYSITLDIENYDTIWIDESNSFITGNEEYLGVNWYYSSSDWLRMWVRKTNNALRVRTPASLGIYSAYITLKYTKTTD